jgi:hypothetical protein
MMSLNWTNSGHSLANASKNGGYGLPYVVELGEWLPSSSATVVQRAAGSCGNEFLMSTAIAAHLAISSMSASRSSTPATIAQLVKKAAKQRM